MKLLIKMLARPPLSGDYVANLQQKSANSLLIQTLLICLLECLLRSSLGLALACPCIIELMIVLICLYRKNSKMLRYALFVCYLMSSFFSIYASKTPLSTGIFPSLSFFLKTQDILLTLLQTVFQFMLTKLWTESEINAYIVESKSDSKIIDLIQVQNFFIHIYVVTILLLMLCRSRDSQKILKKVCSVNSILCKKIKQLELQISELNNSFEESKLNMLSFSHEFKNALNGLIGSLQTVLEEETFDKPEILYLLESANIYGYLLRNLSQNLLDSAKLDNRRLEIAKEDANMSGFLENVWKITSQMIKRRNLNAFMKINENVPQNLKIDTQKLLQVLINLTSNSLKFTQKGQIYFVVEWEPSSCTKTTIRARSSTSIELGRSFKSDQIALRPNSIIIEESEEIDEEGSYNDIKARLSRSSQAKFLGQNKFVLDFNKQFLSLSESLNTTYEGEGYLKISVVDSGCGIHERDTSKLFRKFSQVSDDAKDRKKGTGLGLWITKQLIELMDGDITVKTKRDVGSIFELRIKAEARGPSYDTPTSLLCSSLSAMKHKLSFSAYSLNDLTPISSPKKKVLIADDDSFNVELLNTYAKKQGRDTLIAHNGKDLFDIFKNNYKDIDIIMTDNQMPYVDGVIAAEMIKNYCNSNGLRNIPLYLLTGDTIQIPNSQLESRGITQIIQKPLEFDALNSILS